MGESFFFGTVTLLFTLGGELEIFLDLESDLTVVFEGFTEELSVFFAGDAAFWAGGCVLAGG